MMDLYAGEKLLCEAGLYQLNQTVHSLLLIGTICHDADCGAAYDTQGQNTQKALGVNSSFVLLNPHRRLELIRLLDEECSRASVQTNLILNRNFLTNIAITLLFH